MASDGEIVVYNAQDKELTYDEIWDDTLLIQQYDESMEKAQRQLRKRSSANNTTESELSEAPHSESLNKAGPMHMTKKKKKKKNKKRIEWHIGDACRARFSEDNVVYEATIIAMKPTKSACRVRYVGYDNEEDIQLNRLMKTKGEVSRKQQDYEANLDLSDEASSSVADSDVQTDTDSERSKKRPRPRQNPYSQADIMPPPKLPQSAATFVPPPHLPQLPPPPVLAMDLHSDPSTSEALHTMLMSWYMAGYHSGYYQGLKHSSNQKKED